MKTPLLLLVWETLKFFLRIDSQNACGWGGTKHLSTNWNLKCKKKTTLSANFIKKKVTIFLEIRNFGGKVMERSGLRILKNTNKGCCKQ